jgi:hypothetical protein
MTRCGGRHREPRAAIAGQLVLVRIIVRIILFGFRMVIRLP